MDTLKIGEKLKQIRVEKHMSIKDLSEKSNVSTGMISQIERDKVSPTIVSVHRLAQALNISIGYFFQEDLPKYNIIRNDMHKMITINNDHTHYKILSPDDKQSKMQFMEITLKPDRNHDVEKIAHEGEEGGYVLSGILSLELGDETIDLYPGDSIYFKSTIPHRYVNKQDVDCVSIWTMTPHFF